MANYIMIIAVLAVYGIWLSIESLRAKRDRAVLRHVIYVNGTRGKSTVTRMIDAGLRGMGYRVLSKTTGTVPACVHVDGREEIIERKAPANIREQLKFLHLAAKENAEILVLECMALDPMLQRISSAKMLCANIGVITNARLDHTDVMGDSREEILDCLMEMLPRNGQVFTAEQDLFTQIQDRCKALSSSAVLALPEEAGEWQKLDFPDNTALALAVCRAVSGADDETILRAISAFHRDPYALEVYEKDAVRLVNALSANDADSTKIILDGCGRTEGERLVLLINNRADRPARAREMARLCRMVQPKEVWLLGEQQRALAALCRRGAADTAVRHFTTAEELPLAGVGEERLLILAVGNIKNEGIRLVERARREMTVTGRQ